MSVGLFLLDHHTTLYQSCLDKLSLIPGEFTLHEFPDQESVVQIHNAHQYQQAVILCSLNHPNEKILNLLFLIDALRDLGIKRIGLVAPYLAYMRQDKRFHEGEGVSAHYFANLLSQYIDWLITIDPHLHRIHHLSDIYSVPTRCLTATPAIVDWIKHNIERPLLIGPDSESEQWIRGCAESIDAPFVILKKKRIDDYHVEIELPDLEPFSFRSIVILDDIISTAKTMLKVIDQLANQTVPIYCIGVHGIFAEQSDQKIVAKNCQLVTVNTISHPSNQIDISDLLTVEINNILQRS